MKKILLSIFFVFLIYDFCIAQQTNKLCKNVQHNLFFELWGSSAFVYNITYDCSFQIAEKRKIALGVGGQYIPIFGDIYGISHQINYLSGKIHYLELGAGYSVIWERMYARGEYDYRVMKAVPIRIGYRYQRENGGFFWKIAFVPSYSNVYEDSFTFKPSGGVALGFTFRKRNK